VKSQSSQDLPNQTGRLANPLRQILKDEEGHALFYAYLEREFALENLIFWDAVEVFRTQLEKDTLATSISGEAIVEVLDKFIKPQSVLCVNIAHESRRKVLQQFDQWRNYANSSSNQKLVIKLLIRAQDEVTTMLTMDTFVRFKNTPKGEALVQKLTTGTDTELI
jgi:hypothetical protein